MTPSSVPATTLIPSQLQDNSSYSKQDSERCRQTADVAETPVGSHGYDIVAERPPFSTAEDTRAKSVRQSDEENYAEATKTSSKRTKVSWHYFCCF